MPDLTRPLPRALRLAVVLGALCAAPSSAQPAATPEGEAAFVQALLERMTVEEKLGQLVQYSGEWAVTGPAVTQGGDSEIRAGRVGSYLNVYGAESTCTAQRVAVEESRLGIPLIFGHDVIHGFRTIFPIPLGEAAAWDPDLAERTARVGAREAAAAGLHWTFAPMVDIARDARWGRITEGAGEDAYLASAYAAARVRGFQGTTRESLAADTTILATAKHFVAYGAAEAGRDYATAEVSERALQTTYFPPFQAAIDAGAQSVMAAFNDVAGAPAHASRRLMTDVLRGQMGFDGVVVSDYTGIRELLEHHVAADSAEAGRLALVAGVDIDMVDGIYVKNLIPVVERGEIPTDVLDEAVRRVLRAKWRAGLFADPYAYCAVDRAPEVFLAPAHRQLAREAGVRSIVLLKNDSLSGQPVLPLSRSVRRVAVIGALAADSISALGSWAGAGEMGDVTPILAGLRQSLPDARIDYAPGYPVAPPRNFRAAVDSMLSLNTAGHAGAVRLVQGADAVVLVLGEHREMSGEATSRTEIGLPGAQLALAQRVIEAAGDTPVVVVLTNGRPLALQDLDAVAPAILETWHLGTEMGLSVADVLLGADPGGRLPVTFPRVTGQVPMSYDQRPTGRPPVPGTKYNSKWIDADVTPLYPFGHGLSYTTFAMSGLTLDRDMAARDGARLAEPVRVSVQVANTGDRVGDETVQVYLEDEVSSVARPRRQLAGFRRVTLQPGESRTLTFDLDDQLRVWGLDGAWTLEPGGFTVHVGRSSADTPLTARFEVR